MIVIRSQNGEFITVMGDIYLNQKNKKIIQRESIQLGKYKTKKRCLEIMDEIENWINIGGYYRDLGEQVRDVEEKKVFRMPEK